jgi:excisionase family DNA binding protein
VQCGAIWYTICTCVSVGHDKPVSSQAIDDLLTYSEQFMTVSQLAQYWHVSHKCILQHITDGTLRAFRLGPRLTRISTAEAIRFEQTLKTKGQ